MSVVTNVILITSLQEDTFVYAVNAWLNRNGASNLVPLPTEKCGGSKYLEVEVFAGAFNHAGFKGEELCKALADLIPILMDSCGDASCTVVEQGGNTTQWASNLW